MKYFNNKLDDIWSLDNKIFPESLLSIIQSTSSASDIEGKVQDTVFKLLKSHNYFGLAVPKELEGNGYGIVKCCAAQRLLGSINPGLSIALNMHIFSVGVIKEHWLRKKDISWSLLEAIATQNLIVASAFAEPGLAGNILRSNCSATKVDGGYRVSGKKTPCSLISRSDLICLQFEHQESLHVALIPNKGNGISTQNTWDSLGMRSSESDTLLLDSCFIPQKLIFHTTKLGLDQSPVFKAGLCWFSLLTTATYLGICKSSIELVVEHLDISKSAGSKKRGDIDVFNTAFGSLIADYLTLDSSCYGVAVSMDESVERSSVLLPRSLALKYSSVEMTLKIISKAMEICGGMSYNRNTALSRFWRDAQAIVYHPPTSFVTTGILGNWIQGKDYTFDV